MSYSAHLRPCSGYSVVLAWRLQLLCCLVLLLERCSIASKRIEYAKHISATAVASTLIASKSPVDVARVSCKHTKRCAY
jgi:hypothetical protein